MAKAFGDERVWGLVEEGIRSLSEVYSNKGQLTSELVVGKLWLRNLVQENLLRSFDDSMLFKLQRKYSYGVWLAFVLKDEGFKSLYLHRVWQLIESQRDSSFCCFGILVQIGNCWQKQFYSLGICFTSFGVWSRMKYANYNLVLNNSPIIIRVWSRTKYANYNLGSTYYFMPRAYLHKYLGRLAILR